MRLAKVKQLKSTLRVTIMLLVHKEGELFYLHVPLNNPAKTYSGNSCYMGYTSMAAHATSVVQWFGFSMS